MIAWGTILYGAALSAALATAALALSVRERRAGVLVSAAVAAAAGPIAWNAILRATQGAPFFTDAPVAVFPISWQDTGSGVFALAAASLLLGLGLLGAERARAVIVRSALIAAAALTVDVYLY